MFIFLPELNSRGLTTLLTVLFLGSVVESQIVISGYSLRYPLYLTPKGIEFEQNLTKICGSLTKGDLPSAEWDCILKCHYKRHELYDDEYSHLWPRFHNAGMVTYYLRTYTNAMEPMIKIINGYYARCTVAANDRIADLRMHTFERLSDCRYYGYIYRCMLGSGVG
ncbi:hypothetical protein Ocin01_15399 [Orchesella cincta]|uniref:Uncharacterized protein n=1 Tax=Orchesella cincta TaxID=48709 RepID=A0A1D2MEH2_ORCCI|nr:hypothetical protein Ocin01_15399 [Orchesella cincta]